jgi:cytosol alanyl aminopeptidase
MKSQLVRGRFLVAVSGLAAAIFACSGSQSPPQTTTTAASPALPAGTVDPWADVAKDDKPPQLRLPDNAKPLRYQVELTIDPAVEDFSGVITTQLEFTKATKLLWLNATEIKIDSATLTLPSESITANIVDGGKEFVGLKFPRDIAPGQATLKIAYRAKMHVNDGDGAYNYQTGGDWYAVTQFESTSARQAFPCFDEPAFKVPWQLTIHTKQALATFSNTAITKETADAGGMKTVSFAETTPLPSYLVAFAIGPFETIDAGKTRGGAPIRIVVPKGRTADAAYPVKVTLPLLNLLEDYFGIPYPYPKLDMVSVTIFDAGAMENAGMVTFQESLMLVKPQDMTVDREKRYATVAAHEMAHHWFGNYVTMSWWDDLWLNESFASWVETKVTGQWKPEWEMDMESVRSSSGVMGDDSLDTARAIRQPITTNDDISNAFDGITYSKGEAVLNMIEKSVGEAKFQKGVQTYLQAHARGNATYEDFVGAMNKASGQELTPMFDSFVRKSGLPLVVLNTSKSGAATKLSIVQRRYRPMGSKIDPKQLWTLPVCVRWGGVSGKVNRQCITMTSESAEIQIPGVPTWIFGNVAGHGYYRTLQTPEMLSALLKNLPALSGPELLNLVGDVAANVASGDVKIATALEMVALLANSKQRQIIDQTVGIVSGVDDYVSDELRPNYERMITKLYAKRALQMGFASKPGESPDSKKQRATLLRIVAGLGKNAAMIKTATELTWKWLDDHKAIEPEMVDAVLAVAGRFGNQTLFDRLHADAKKSKERDERVDLLGAMGAFIDPAISKQALALMLTNEFEIRESLGLLQGAFSEPRNRAQSYLYVKNNFDAIAAKMPAMYRSFLAFTFVALCDDSRIEEVRSTFGPRIEKFEGGPRSMAQALEQLSLCSVARKAQLPGVAAFLKTQ